MLDSDYLVRGLDGLSHAHGEHYFRDGHLAAATVSAYWLCHENQLDLPAQDAVRSQVDRYLSREAIFKAVPDEAADARLLDRLLDALAAGIDDLRQVGHNIIFGATALKAFHQFPRTVTPYRVDGICRLLANFTTTQNTALSDLDGVPGLDDEHIFIEFMFREYLHAVALWSGYGQGWAGHLLTIGHAVLELARHGQPDLAARARRAYRMYIATLRRGPGANAEPIPDHPALTSTPLQADYWRRKTSVTKGLGHAFKYPYSFYNLLAGLHDETLKQRCLDASFQIF